MLRLKLTVDRTWLDGVRSLPERAQRNIRRKIQTILVPELQADVDNLLADDPGPVSSPFVFYSTKSKGYWFRLIEQHPELTSGGGGRDWEGQHWLRTGLIQDSWVVTASDRFRGSQVILRNTLSESTGTKPYPAKYVYEPRVPGHIATGWPALLKAAEEAMHAKMTNRLHDLWFEAMNEAIKGRSE